jgi:hypothetical protein
MGWMAWHCEGISSSWRFDWRRDPVVAAGLLRDGVDRASDKISTSLRVAALARDLSAWPANAAQRRSKGTL